MMSKLLAWLKSLSEPRWPEGIPYIVEGERVGTIAKDGGFIGAPGLRFTVSDWDGFWADIEAALAMARAAGRQGGA